MRGVENAALHPAIRADIDESSRARLFLWVSLVAGPALLVVIAAWALMAGEPVRGAIVGMGHTLAVSSFLLLRSSPSVRFPARLMCFLSCLQLTSAAWWTGGIESLVIGTFPVATVFLGFIADIRTAALTALGLASGLVCLVVTPHLGFIPGAPVENHWIIAAVAIWSLATGLGVSVVHQRQMEAHLVQVSRELDMRTAAQAEAERLRDQREGFLRYISHELRNPLTTVSAGLECHEYTADPERRARALRSVRLASDRLVRLADDVLDLSSLEKGRIVLRREKVELGAVCAACVEELRGRTSRGGDQIFLQADAPVPAEGDPDRLVQVVGNLVMNALKYAGGTRVDIRVWQTDGRACVRVSDAGPGIAPALRPVLFEPFSRAEGLDRKGSGLGLTIARDLMRTMGGDLVFLEDEGPGAHFELWLPLTPE